jgi:hypothetical protein
MHSSDRKGTHIIPDCLRVHLHAFGGLTHFVVENSAMLRVDYVLENDETVPVKRNDGCSDMLFSDTTRDPFFVGHSNDDRLLELEWCSNGPHDDVCYRLFGCVGGIFGRFAMTD